MSDYTADDVQAAVETIKELQQHNYHPHIAGHEDKSRQNYAAVNAATTALVEALQGREDIIVDPTFVFANERDTKNEIITEQKTSRHDTKAKYDSPVRFTDENGEPVKNSHDMIEFHIKSKSDAIDLPDDLQVTVPREILNNSESLFNLAVEGKIYTADELNHEEVVKGYLESDEGIAMAKTRDALNPKELSEKFVELEGKLLDMDIVKDNLEAGLENVNPDKVTLLNASEVTQTALADASPALQEKLNTEMSASAEQVDKLTVAAKSASAEQESSIAM